MLFLLYYFSKDHFLLLLSYLREITYYTCIMYIIEYNWNLFKNRIEIYLEYNWKLHQNVFSFRRICFKCENIEVVFVPYTLQSEIWEIICV